ncbi:MAG: HAD family hydrolase [Actinomyces ruminicola]|uniref:Putative hydrolase of the HAD superfamily n=1 Tax=Actinomyces ruminicola TaxID=332524 RepID=A0A1G9XC33_9ACTO|nr:HAD-IA family hydrolase [Actinomyces ruminicola]MBE6480855.1 HAD family hydrolase [Actinomyces ruminicola]SDM94349.1 putative hydrolase of the HAD superfamily [Actinomyces ruminicola]
MTQAPSPAPPAIPALGTSPVRAVLFDADGVLQLIGTPWDQALTAGGGEVFCRRLLAEEGPALRGHEDLRTLLERLAGELSLGATVEQLLELWWQATPDPLAWQVVRDLRTAGYTTVLATNQQHERRAWMRSALGYDGLCDVDAYSCTLGVAKPSPDYFHTVLELVGVRPQEALFVDDNAANIAQAAALGIRTVHHPADAGGVLLRQEVVSVLDGAAPA